MKWFRKVLKWFGMIALALIIAIVIFGLVHIITIKMVTDSYTDYGSDDSDIALIAPYIRMNVTNQYLIGSWAFNDYGMIYTSWFTRGSISKSIKLIITKKIIPPNVIDIPIEQRITNDKKMRNNFIDNSVMYETYNSIPLREGYRFMNTIKYDKKVKILSAYMHGEILKDEKIETDRYRYRLIYANQRKLAFCEDAKNLRQGVLYFYFERRGFINTDIAIVQMKNEPGNLYFVYAFDEWAGKNHETIKGFMKDYFDIAVR